MKASKEITEKCEHKLSSGYSSYIGKGMNDKGEYICECLFCGEEIDVRKKRI